MRHFFSNKSFCFIIQKSFFITSFAYSKAIYPRKTPVKIEKGNSREYLKDIGSNSQIKAKIMFS